MIVTMAVAANRKRLPQLWRRIHQLNYLIFAAVYIKAMLIGTANALEASARRRGVKYYNL
jgi:DMSO/TMAO reductase YedYZ heme-binding membrane subunit